MTEKTNNLRRESGLDDQNRRRFEQEVAEEIGLSRERNNRNRLGRGGPEATYTGPKSGRATGNYGQLDQRTGRERQERC